MCEPSLRLRRRESTDKTVKGTVKLTKIASIGGEKRHSDCNVNVVVVKRRAPWRYHSDRPGHSLAFTILSQKRPRSPVMSWAWHHLVPLGSSRGFPIRRPPSQSEGIGKDANRWDIMYKCLITHSRDPTVFTLVPYISHMAVEFWRMFGSRGAPALSSVQYACSSLDNWLQSAWKVCHSHPAGFSILS